MGRSTGHLAAAALLTVAALAAQESLTRTGQTFVVTLHPAKLDAELAARLAGEALAAAESTRPVLEKLYQRPAKPPVIHLYAAREEYDPVAKEPGWQFVRDMVCQRESGVSHVLLRPVLSESVLAAIGLPESARNDIVVQAAMLAACDRSELARKDSRCAEIFAAGVLDAMVFTDARDGVDPLRDSRFWFLAREVKEMKSRSLRSLCDMVYPVATRSEYDYVLQGNAVIAQLFAGTGSGWAKKLLNTKVKDNDLAATRRTTAMQAVLGADEKRSEERFAKLMAASTPRFTVLTPLVALRGGRILMAAGKKDYARLGGAFLPPAGPYALRATVEIVDSGANTLSFLLDATAVTWLEVKCRGGTISVATREASEKNEWQAFEAPIEVGKPFALSIEVRDTIRLLVDAQQVAEVPLAGRAMRNDWAVTKLDGMVWVENPRCEPLDAPAKK